MIARQRARARIRELNDQMRRAGFSESGNAARWLFTRGVMALGVAAMREAIRCVAEFDAFDDGNDPHGEHDFGAIEIAGERLFWKIDYYDRSMTAGSEDPSDAALTCRVLTIMLASEY